MVSPTLRDTRFRLTIAQAEELAKSFGTPLYVVDEHHFRTRVREYVAAMQDAYPRGEVSFATKANSTLALVAIAYQEGCSIDVASEGELRAAMRAGVPAPSCHLHGNVKSLGELEFALDAGVGMIMVDSFAEIRELTSLKDRVKTTQFVLRLAPGVDPHTHAKISTGQADTKFGFNIVDGSADRGVRECMAAGLPLIGFHCHVGSQLLDPEAQRSGGELIAQFAVEMKMRHGFSATYLNVGGGLGVTYTDSDHPMGVRDYCRLVAQSVTRALEGSGLQPTLGQEPGRALVAESCTTLYRVGVIKTVPAKEIGTRTYVCVDGGLSDNPRPALYGSKYTVEMLGDGSDERKTVTVSGRHCETDRLFEDVELPDNLQEGDLIQVLCTGAYNSSMASNYNRYPRPATALIRENGTFDLIQRRDTWEEMLAREIVPADLSNA